MSTLPPSPSALPEASDREGADVGAERTTWLGFSPSLVVILALLVLGGGYLALRPSGGGGAAAEAYKKSVSQMCATQHAAFVADPPKSQLEAIAVVGPKYQVAMQGMMPPAELLDGHHQSMDNEFQLGQIGARGVMQPSSSQAAEAQAAPLVAQETAWFKSLGVTTPCFA